MSGGICDSVAPKASSDWSGSATTALNRLNEDKCARKVKLDQSTSPLSYALEPMKFNHCQKCRPEIGIVGGTAVSHPSGNLVDVENHLLGRDRPMTRCPQYKHMPTPAGAPLRGKEYIKPVCHPEIDTSAKHLRPCNFTSYPPVPAEPPLDVYRCPANPPKHFL